MIDNIENDFFKCSEFQKCQLLIDQNVQNQSAYLLKYVGVFYAFSDMYSNVKYFTLLQTIKCNLMCHCSIKFENK